jgi:hypothetical protein
MTTVNKANVTHTGTQIILPMIDGKPMSYDEAIEWMNRKKQEDEQAVSIHHVLPCSPLDGAYAFHRAIASTYTSSQGVPTPGFFGSKPPQMIGVQSRRLTACEVYSGKGLQRKQNENTRRGIPTGREV